MKEIMKEIKKLYTIGDFSNAMNKLFEKDLSKDDCEYLLGCAILLLKRFNQNNERELFELAYNIILRCCLATGDFVPLYDISCNYGFFPTVRYINAKSMLDENIIGNALIDFQLNRYKTDDYIETFEQYKTKSRIINSKNKNISFIAPTSSGKSSLVLKHLLANEKSKKAIILVPTKSLISQTYTEFRGKITDRKILCHDAMYNGEDRFVGIMTQERALRLLTTNENLNIDNIYVDEAHNILSNDPRNILLSRVIKICKQRNSELQTIYLSPFVNDSNNLLQGNAESIYEQRIEYNIKEPNIFELDKDGNQFVYDRFSDRFYNFGGVQQPFEYVKEHQGKKNFFFLVSPSKIEKFANELYENTPELINKDAIDDLKKVLAKNVHPSFKMIQYLDHGIIYLHAKIPDQIKDFLENQFRNNDSIKYLVANSVILEGINLPIDCLFVFDIWNMSSSKLLNLMGRVNRLNNVFDLKSGSLKKLLPSIHFVSSSYCKNNMSSKIKKIYQTELDEVTNPLLDNYSAEKLSKTKKDKTESINKEILRQENVYFSNPQTKIEEIIKMLIANGMNQLIEVSNNTALSIIKNIKVADQKQSVLDLVKSILIDNINVIDYEFARLRNRSALMYYAYFLNELKNENLATIISSQMKYYDNHKNNNPYMYIGSQYGEINPYDGPYGGRNKVYVDLRTKNYEELINLLIVKTKIEQDFIGFQYKRAVAFLHDCGVITDNQFNYEIYGTADVEQIGMLNIGLSRGLLSFLDKNNQLHNIRFDEYGNLTGNSKIKQFRNLQDSFVQFELDKYIYFGN